MTIAISTPGKSCNGARIRDINIQYACGCAKTALADTVDWELAAQDGRVRIDRKFTRIGEYLETVYFDYAKCSKCRMEAAQ